MEEFSLYALEAGSDQLHLTARINRRSGSAASTADNMCAAAASVLNSRGMRILNERVFGTLDFYETYLRIRERFPDSAQRRFSYIQGAPVHGNGLSGIQIHAVRPFSNSNPGGLYDRRHPCGSIWKRDDTTFIYLTGLHGLRNGNRGRSDQAASMFEAMKRLLASQSADCGNVVRTWIYLADILDWYDTFNAVRTEKFRSFGLIPAFAEESDIDPAHLPASTGVGGHNPAGMSCYGDVLAVSGNIPVSVLQGIRQPSAYSYGSAFSRGICIEEKECRQLFVSGTAAIDPNGRSLYPYDAEAQIRTTLEVVEELIGEKGANFKDIGSATVYLKRAGDWSVYEKLALRFGLMNLPAVFIIADICRDELLFEMDAIAIIR
jgi:enamine deaminase RidA (YjgF/YER057c/UK114 family)